MNGSCIHKVLAILAPRHIHFFLMAIAAACLGTAFVAEYGFHIVPCDLCLYERWIYASLILVGLLGLKTQAFRGHRGILAQLAVLSAGIALTFYHVGVEHHWWAAPASCAGVGLAGTFEEFTAQLKSVARPRCDQVTWSIFGISATLWNLMLQGGLAFLTALSLYLPYSSRSYQK